MEEQSNNEALTAVSKPKPSKGVRVVLVVLLILLTVAGVGYSIYSWQQNKDLQIDVNNKSAQIKDLSSEVNSLKTAATVKANENIIPIKELGISITVPDSIKDLTYSYESFSDGVKAVGLSTQSIVDKYNDTHSCNSFDGANNASGPALGSLEKNNGQYSGSVHMDTVLVKQFSSYYVDFAGPQSACTDNQGSDVLTALSELKASFSTIEQL